MRAVAALLPTIVLTAAACLPSVRKAQLPVPPDPITFSDRATARVVTPVLVLPRYSSHSGMSTGAGHGPGAMVDRFYVADAFIYHAGQEFRPKQPRSVGAVWLGAAFTGRGVTLDGVLVVASGYRPKWVWNLWGRDLADQFQLDPLPTGSAKDALDEIRMILHDRELVPRANDLWSLGPRYKLESRLTEDELRTVDEFLAEGISTLGAEPGG